MKLLLITILLAGVSGCFADTLTIPDFKLDPEIHNQLAKAAIQAFVQNYGEELVSLLQTQNPGAETRATLFPPFPDVDIPLEDFVGIIPDYFNDLLVGTFSFTDVFLKDTENIKHFFQLIPIPVPTLQFILTTGTITLTGTHDTDLLFSAGLFNIKGDGPFELNIIDALVDLEIKVLYDPVTDRLRITTFDLDLAIEEVVANFGDTNVNEIPIDWVGFSSNVTFLIKDNLWRARDIVRDLVFVQGNGVLEDCPLSELIDGNFTCILNPSTSSPEPTTMPTPEGSSTPADSSASTFAQFTSLIMLMLVMYLFA